MTPTNAPVVYKFAVLYRSYISGSFTAPSSGWPYENLRNMKERHNTVIIQHVPFVVVMSETFDTDCVLCEAETKVFVKL